MGLFDGLLGGVVGAQIAIVVNGLIEKHGGVQGIVAQLEAQGLGGAVRSWVGTGANQPITPDQVHQALGSDALKQLAAKLGMSPEDLAAKLSKVLRRQSTSSRRMAERQEPGHAYQQRGARARGDLQAPAAITRDSSACVEPAD